MSDFCETCASPDCECCEGNRVRAPVEIRNRTGLPTVAYRSGTHAEYFDSMLARLSSADRPALRDLRTRAVDDFSIALLDAFAATADVLTFYQERLINESYLRTATERTSVGELAKLLGYQLGRGVSASTDLVFTVTDPPAPPANAPPPVATPDVQPVVIPSGTKVQSIPGADESPVVFETRESIEGRPEWNEFRPLSRIDQDLGAQSRSLLVLPPAGNVEIGDRLLFVGATGRDIRAVSAVAEDPYTNATRLHWQAPLGRAYRVADGYSVFVADEAASVFGHNAVSWPALSTAAKADYLGVTEAQYLVMVAADPSIGEEWRSFSIFSPDQPQAQQANPVVVEPTVESVLARVVNTTDSMADASGGAASRALPNTAIDIAETVGEVITGTAAALATTDLGNAVESDTVAIKNAIVTLLTELVPGPGLSAHPPPTNVSPLDLAQSVADLVTNDDALATTLNDLVVAVNSLADPTTLASNADTLAAAVSPVNLLNQVLGSLATALAPLGAGAERLVDNLEHLRRTLSEDVVTRAMGGFVRSIAEAAVNAEAVGTAAELERLVRYATGIADAAVRYAPGNNLVTQFNEFMLSMEATAGAAAGKADFDQLVDVGQDGALAGIAAANAAGVVALHPLLTPLLVVNMGMAGAAESSATAFSQSIHRALDLAMQPENLAQPVSRGGYTILQNRIDLDREYPGLRPGDWVILSRPGVERSFRVVDTYRASRSQYLISATVTRLQIEGQGLELFDDHLRATTVWVATRTVDPDRIALETPVSGRRVRLDRRIPALPQGRRVVISGYTHDHGEPYVGTVRIQEVREVPDDSRVDVMSVTELEFIASPGVALRRRDLRLFGNVALADHGESTGEVLGGGDATRAFQAFALKQAPLTYTASADPGGSESSLEVVVNDVRWEEVPFFLDQPAEARVYVTRQRADGALEVRFGDGVNGARLPTGTNNVRAAYRKGTGLPGMVRKAQLSQLMTRPLGLEAAVNPRAASGADDPEAIEDARENAPLTVLTLDRAVSLRDYEDYSRAFAGIAKAQALWFWDGRQRIILITVAGPGGATLDPAGTTINGLRDSLRRYGDPYVSFHVQNFRPAWFRFGARVAVDVGHSSEIVFPALEKALRGYFAFAGRRFGQPVVLSEVMQVAQQVAGVKAVDVDVLYRDGRPAALNKRLIADQASLDPQGRSVAAELLLLHSDNFDSLEILQ